MTVRDPLQCTFEDARLNQLRDGIAMSTDSKINLFEEMLSFALHFERKSSRVRVPKVEALKSHPA